MEPLDPQRSRPGAPRPAGTQTGLPDHHSPQLPPPRSQLNWVLVLGLGALALIRPLARINGLADAIGSPAGPILLTVLITGAWVAIVGLSRVARPVITLTLAGLAYGVYVIPLSAALSTMLDGTLEGPVATPLAIVPLLATNAAWGALAGVLALGVQAATGRRR
ncbi:hypothetical protein AA0Y32_06980 [Georgenia phoenicis]|uniref:hypothetical protein n=1 Tax=unclassified Georgenia TaxID=2626815 RepID=UPI0039B081D1